MSHRAIQGLLVSRTTTCHNAATVATGGRLTEGERIPNDYKDSSIRACQHQVDQWVTTTGVRYFSELTNTAILAEEVGEVARVMARRYGDQSFKPSDENTDLAEEMADVLFVLCCLANQTGVDLQAAFEEKMEKRTKRDRERHAANPKLKTPPDNSKQSPPE